MITAENVWRDNKSVPSISSFYKNISQESLQKV